MMTAMKPGHRQSARPLSSGVALLYALLLVLGCVALAQACAQAGGHAAAATTVMAEASAGTVAAGPPAGHLSGPQSDTDLLEGLSACLAALTGLVMLVRAHREPSLLRTRPPRHRSLPVRAVAGGHRACGAPAPHALCVVRV